MISDKWSYFKKKWNNFKKKRCDKLNVYKESFFTKKRSILLWIGLIIGAIIVVSLGAGSDYKNIDESYAVNFLNVNAAILVTILAVTMSFTLLGLQFLAKSHTPRALGAYLKDKVIWGFPTLYVSLITLSMFSVTYPVILPPSVLIEYAFFGTFFSLAYLICFIYYTVKKIQPEKIISDTYKNIQSENPDLIVNNEGKLDSTDLGFRPFIILEQTLLKSVNNNDIVSFDLGMGKMGELLYKWLKQVQEKNKKEIEKKEKEIKDKEIAMEKNVNKIIGIAKKVKEIPINEFLKKTVLDEIVIKMIELRWNDIKIKVNENKIKINEIEKIEKIDTKNSDEEYVKKQKLESELHELESELHELESDMYVLESLLQELKLKLKLKSELDELDLELDKLDLELDLKSEYINSFFFRIFSQIFTECVTHHREQFIIQYQDQLFEHIIMMVKYKNIKAIDNFWDTLEHVSEKIFKLDMTYASDSFIKNIRELMNEEFEMIHVLETSIDKHSMDKIKEDTFMKMDFGDMHRSPIDMRKARKELKINMHIYNALAYDQFTTLKALEV